MLMNGFGRRYSLWITVLGCNILTGKGRSVKCRQKGVRSLSDTFVDFKEIKQRVSIEDVLGRYGVQLRRVNQNSLRGRCPLPTHSSAKSAESFSAHTGKNIWACQSASCAEARQGKKGGNILDFVAL